MAWLAIGDEYPGSGFERLRGQSWVGDRALSGDALLEQRAGQSVIPLNSGQSRAIGSLHCDAAQIPGISRQLDDTPAYVSAAWWIIATLIGTTLGARDSATTPSARLLAGARTQHSLPDLQPARTIFNRLWPLLVPSWTMKSGLSRPTAENADLRPFHIAIRSAAFCAMRML